MSDGLAEKVFISAARLCRRVTEAAWEALRLGIWCITVKQKALRNNPIRDAVL